MTSTQIPTAPAARVVDDLVRIVSDIAPHMTHTQRLNMARDSILASIVSDAQSNGGRQLHHYAAQLDDVDQRIAAWDAAGQAAEICQQASHFDQFPDAPATPNLQAVIDAHVRAHLVGP